VHYLRSHLVAENITIIKSAFDAAMQSAATATSASVGGIQLLFMVISLPQAFILMKILQTLDYYIYIDCKHPSNFAQFLKMITSSAIDFIPNLFEWAEDDEGEPIFERFSQYGVKVHIFANIGKMFTLLLLLLALKLLLMLIGRCVKKIQRWHRYISYEIFFGLLESHHMDSVLSIIIFIGQRERVNHKTDLSKYLVILFVSLYALFLISMYLFMAYTVSRLTASYFEHILVDVKDFKREDWKFILADKQAEGNKFQRHFNLVLLFKDICFAVLLYALYYHPLALIIILSAIQLALLVLIFMYPPYNQPRMNTSLKITQSLYMLLNLWFITLIIGGSGIKEKIRYYFIGFSMIVNVLMVLVCNIAFSIMDTISSWKKKKDKDKKKKQNQVMAADRASSNSFGSKEDSVEKQESIINAGEESADVSILQSKRSTNKHLQLVSSSHSQKTSPGTALKSDSISPTSCKPSKPRVLYPSTKPERTSLVRKIGESRLRKKCIDKKQTNSGLDEPPTTNQALANHNNMLNR
jgi:hypothetical protein